MRFKTYEKKIAMAVKCLENDTRFSQTKYFTQHGTASVFVHCVCVAYKSCSIVHRLGVKVDLNSLIIGALLHDYFLYDWHDGKLERKIHGFTHPGKAFRNASQDMVLNKIESDIIKKHMFPLVPIPPLCRESWIVCLADKICATEETVFGECKGRKAVFAKKLLEISTKS